MMESDQVKKAEESKTRGLVDIVFSWSFHDALNKNLYMGKVQFFNYLLELFLFENVI